MTELQWLASYFADASHHFLLSGLMGCSAFCSMQIMWCVFGWAWERGTHRRINSAVGYGILITCILAGLTCALLAHYALDYYSTWFTTPLGPPLTIDTGPQG